MRRPPPLVALPHYPVVGGLALLSIAVTLAYWTKAVDVSPLMAEPFVVREGQVWRLLTSILPHASTIHLVFNLLWLWTLGSLVEEAFGHARTTGLVVLLAGGSMAAEYAFLDGGIGLSGVVYGLFGFLWVLSRRDPRFYGAVDPQTTQTFVAWFFLCIVLTVTNLLPVANIAHGAGAVLGLLVGYTVAARRHRLWYGAGLVALTVAMAAAVYARPYVNLSATERGDELAQLAYHELIAGRNEAGLRHLRASVELHDDQPPAWFNLGLAYQRLGNYAEAAKAFGRAAELSPANGDYRGALKHAQLMMEFDRASKEPQPGGGAAESAAPAQSLGKTSGPAAAATRSIETP